MKRKWRENEEMKRDSLSTYISSFSLYFLPLYPFPIIKKCHILSQNVKYGTFDANVTKQLNIRFEKIIPGRIGCKEASQVVPA